MDYQTRYAQAHGIYQSGQNRVATKPQPTGQKYPNGTRVRIADDLGVHMNHFPRGVNATVQYTYGHAYNCEDVKSYSLNVDGRGSVAWYDESQLTPISRNPASDARETPKV